jgi:hypothetical protein
VIFSLEILSFELMIRLARFLKEISPQRRCHRPHFPWLSLTQVALRKFWVDSLEWEYRQHQDFVLVSPILRIAAVPVLDYQTACLRMNRIVVPLSCHTHRVYFLVGFLQAHHFR